jgi:dipeptidyl aminopeptidase/acylaminoacyl peptidase
VPPTIARILDARGAGSARLSPDGRWLYYVTDITGTAQLWRVALAGGMPQRLSFECDRVGSSRLSRDGARIAYVADSGGNEKWQVWVMDADGTDARRLTSRPDRIHHIVDWSPKADALYVMANLRHPLYFDLYRIDLAGGEPRLLVQRDGTGFGGVALDDGSVVFTTNRGRMDKNHLELLEPGGTRRLLTPEAPIAQHSTPHRFGDALLVLSDRDREFQGVARVDRSGGFERLVDIDHDVDALATARDVWAYSVNCEGVSETHLVRDGRDELVRGLDGHVVGIDVAADGTLAATCVGYDSPGTILVARPGEAARVVVPPIMAGLDPADLPAHELVRWRSFDGMEIPGFLLRRRDTDRAPRPTVIQVHGGPEGQARPTWNPSRSRSSRAASTCCSPTCAAPRGTVSGTSRSTTCVSAWGPSATSTPPPHGSPTPASRRGTGSR